MLSADEVRLHAEALREQHPEAVLSWAAQTFPGRIALSVSFGGAGVALAHMLTRVDRTIPVVFLDTGMLFPETYTHRRDFAERYGLTVIDVKPLRDPGALYETDTDGCCAIRKVEPMARAVAGYDAWVSGVRRDQGPSRAALEVIELHEAEGREFVKVHPLAYWGRTEVWRYLTDNAIPYNPLLDQGYSSLGCVPCTRTVAPGESERAGRWSGTGKTECGLHTFSTKR